MKEHHLVESSSHWRFGSEAEDFRLVSEAYRIGIAYLFATYSVVNSSSIKLLLHQISGLLIKVGIFSPMCIAE